MGKRSSTSSSSVKDFKKKQKLDSQDEKDDNVNIITKEKVKKCKKNNTEPISTDSSTIELNKKNAKSKKNQPKKVLVSDPVVQEMVFKTEQTIHSDNSKIKGKKTIFVDDQPQEVAGNESNTAPSKKKLKNKQIIEEDEEVKDEDIDKFCDEISENDNVQYENWIKLIEAKLHAKK